MGIVGFAFTGAASNSLGIIVGWGVECRVGGGSGGWVQVVGGYGLGVSPRLLGVGRITIFEK